LPGRALAAVAAGLAVLAATAALAVEPPASVAAKNAVIEAAAKAARRGLYPRAFSGEQSYWTLVGVDGGAQSGLISEDGAVELGKRGFSIEPFVIEDGRLITWADAAVSQSLKDGYLPVPSVTWRRPGWTLKITSFASGDAKSPRLTTRYEVRNLTRRPRTLALALAVRPLQVNGPEQFLNTPGGFSPIVDLAWDGAALVVNGRRRVWPLSRADRFVAGRFGGALPEGLRSAGGAGGPVHDADGLASGTLIYKLTLPAGGRVTVAWVAPLGDAAARPEFSRAWLDRQQAVVESAWRERLGRVSFTVPARARAVVEEDLARLDAHLARWADAAAGDPVL